MEVIIQNISDHADNFSHCECGEDRADSKPLDVPEEEEGQSGGHDEAGHVEGDLDSGVWNPQNVRHFPRKQVCRNDRETAAVGEGDSDTENEIAYHEVCDLVSESHRESREDSLVDI